MITSIDLVNFGICELTNESADVSVDSLTGYFLLSDEIMFLSRTNKIKIEKGLAFGIKYLIKGIDEENAETFDVRIIHPTLTNPDTNKTSSEVTETKSGCIDETNFDYFKFEYTWEMKSGKWYFQVLQSTRLLFNKEFDLYI